MTQMQHLKTHTVYIVETSSFFELLHTESLSSGKTLPMPISFNIAFRKMNTTQDATFGFVLLKYEFLRTSDTQVRDAFLFAMLLDFDFFEVMRLCPSKLRLFLSRQSFKLPTLLPSFLALLLAPKDKSIASIFFTRQGYETLMRFNTVPLYHCKNVITTIQQNCVSTSISIFFGIIPRLLFECQKIPIKQRANYFLFSFIYKVIIVFKFCRVLLSFLWFSFVLKKAAIILYS